MPKEKTVLSFLLIVAMVFAIALTALADGHISTGDTTIASETNPYKYGTAPDGLYVFLYHGYNPYFADEIDTSDCELEHLYVHNQVTNEVLSISTQTVTAYTTTKDSLYYITEDQTIYKTDYSGSEHAVVYRCIEGYVRDISTYWDMLVLVVGDNKVLFLDTATGYIKDSFILTDLDWVFMLSKFEVMVATMSGEYYVYQLSTKSLSEIESEVEANNRINQAVLEASGAEKSLIARTIVATSITPKVQENDISFPLAAYPATIYDKNQVQNFNHQRPLSWFHVNGQEGCSSSNCDSYAGTGECEGFARYAHDAYLHILDETITYSAWKTSRHAVETDYRFDGSQDTYKTFFNNLKPGAYVRYGKDTDPSPENGAHSIVFVNIDETGIWVYECNQAYDSDPSHGCGVHYQYYTFERLARQYQFAAHYVNHSFTGGNTAMNYAKHRVECSMCYGYLVQSHTGNTSYAYLNTSKHKVFFSCCNGYVLEPHDIAARMCL